jgi:hypothetical protein
MVRAELEKEDEMQLQEVDTIQDLKVWVGENMQGATVEEGEGGIVIRTNLASSMGGYLYERGGVMSDYGYAVEDGGIICPKCADNPMYPPSELERVDKEGYPDGYTCDECWEVKL